MIQYTGWMFHVEHNSNIPRETLILPTRYYKSFHNKLCSVFTQNRYDEKNFLKTDYFNNS
jgi:hypothetical protein